MWRIYSLLLMNLFPDIGIFLRFGILVNLNLLQRLVISIMSGRSWWFHQEVVHPFSNPPRLTMGRTPSTSISHSCLPLQKPQCSFPSLGLKKTGKHPASLCSLCPRSPYLRTHGWLLGCHLGKTKSVYLFGLCWGEKLRKLNKQKSGNLAFVLHSSFNFCSPKKGEKL